MQNNTKFFYFFSKGQTALLLVVVIVVGVIALPAMVTQAQQAAATPTPTPTPAPVLLPNFLVSGNQPADVNYNRSRLECSGIIANASNEVWQVWPLTGLVELGNGTRLATVEIRQCSGYYRTAGETDLIKIWIQQPDREFINIPYEPTLVSSAIDGSEYAADATYQFPINSQPGTYTLFIGNDQRGWLEYDVEVRTGSLIRLQDPITNSPETEFPQGGTIGIDYRWFRPASGLEVGLYRIGNQSPLLTTWKVTVDQSGNYRGQLSIADDAEPDTYQLAVCNLDGGACNLIRSELFYVVSKTDASLPYNSNSSLPTELDSE